MKYQEKDKTKLLKNGDKVIVRIPVLDHPITINEVHAAQLGLLGLFVGLLYASGSHTIASGVSVMLLSYAVLGNPAFHSLDHDKPEYKTIGMRTIKHEPWWFAVPYVTTFLIGLYYVAPIV